MSIYSDDPAPTSGENYTLSCNISDEVRTYEHQWKRNGTVFSSEPSLDFIPLRLFDGGQYTCESIRFPEVNYTFDLVVQSEDLLTARNDYYNSNSDSSPLIFVTVTAPTSVTVMSSKPNPIRPIASDMLLECNVEYSESCFNFPITVNVIWTGPNSNAPIATNQTLLNVGIRNTSVMIMVYSFGRQDSGNYSCRAFLSSTSMFLNNSRSLSSTIVVTTGTKLKYCNVASYLPWHSYNINYHIFFTVHVHTIRCLHLTWWKILQKQQCHSHY